MNVHSGALLAGVLFTAAAFVAPSLQAQDAKDSTSSSSSEPQPKDQRLLTFGVGVRFITLGTLQGGSTSATVAEPSSTINYSGSATAMKYDYGAILELRLNRHFSFVTEGFYHRVSYKEVASTTYNPPIPRGVILNVVEEDTKARVFEIPALIKFRNIRPSGILHHTFITGGGTFRMVTNIKSTTTQTYSDSSTKVSTTPVVPHSSTVAGITAGAGMRFTDELGIKVTPEIRYTHWLDSNFVLQGISFPKNQMEVGISLSF